MIRTPALVAIATIAASLALAACTPDRVARPAAVRAQATPAPADAGDCGAPAIALHDVQGRGATSPLAGRAVAVEGIVSHRYAGIPGFFLEAPASARDADPATSEAVYVVPAEGVDAPAAGAHVRIDGRVAETGERGTITTITTDRPITTCAQHAALPPPVAITAPLDAPQREALEAMRVTIPGPATLTGTYQMLGRGVLAIALGGRVVEPTERHPPGPEQRALAAANAAREFVLDGSATESFAPLWFLPRAPSREEPWRTGSRLAGIAGILDERGGYRVQLTAPLADVEQAPRPAPPARTGVLRIASFNVFNFFNGDGAGGGFPTARGASDAAELARQGDKIARVVDAIGPDVAALMEVENDGYGDASAIAALVAAINARAGERRYDYVRFDRPKLGDAEITVAIVYRRDRVVPQGAPAARFDGAFAAQNRVPIAQRFVARAGGAPFVVVANHFKSKSGCSADAPEGDRDRRDGQACWNATRVAAARDLVAWLAGDPTRAGRAVDTVIVGDLNAYGEEDPVRAIRDAGYGDVVARALGEEAYSFVYDNHVGRLDHALASPGFAARVAGVAEWHVNADELGLFDFNLEGKSPARQALGAGDPYRASDHDPLVVDLAR